MEQRLIDANALIDLVNKEKAPIWWKEIIAGWINKQPTVDAVPVVRCKDCKRSIKYNDKLWCDKLAKVGSWVDTNWFCADGERTHG